MYTIFRVKMGFMGGIKETTGAGREIFFINTVYNNFVSKKIM
jgi:hypothetical protein